MATGGFVSHASSFREKSMQGLVKPNAASAARKSGNPIGVLLANVAMLAVLYRFDDEAANIQAVASRTTGDPGALRVANALLHVFRGDSAEAVDILAAIDGVSKTHLHADLGRAVLAYALRELGEPSWRKICAEVLMKSRHEGARLLCLEQIRLAKEAY
jgi:hypothetical protein